MTRLLPPAAYVRAGSVDAATEHRHTGLALPLYTHFTSPIRRYADQLVHRMLGASLGWPGYADTAAEHAHEPLRLDALARTLNERKAAAKQACAPLQPRAPLATVCVTEAATLCLCMRGCKTMYERL